MRDCCEAREKSINKCKYFYVFFLSYFITSVVGLKKNVSTALLFYVILEFYRRSVSFADENFGIFFVEFCVTSKVIKQQIFKPV